jgi:hypothetical protein
MEKLILLLKLLPYLPFLYIGIFSILEVLFPSLREPDFNRWEIDEVTGTSVQILGWRKVLRPPRVLAQGYMSDKAACATALAFGLLFLSVGAFGIRHVIGLPSFLPDLFEALTASSH